MPLKTYIEEHPLRAAFLANQLDRLADLISVQGETPLQEEEIEFPARAVSDVLLIGERNEISTAEIAEELQQPHQVVTQRVELLIKADIVTRIPDPQDGRRKLLHLTDKGTKQFERLKICLARSAQAFSALFQEVDCDLSSAILRTTEALNQFSVLTRVKTR